jgi:hypothetical protein
MQEKTTKLIELIDTALNIVTSMQSDSSSENSSENLVRTAQALSVIKERASTGQLGSSNGVITLGLVRGVSDWIEPLNSPLLGAVGAIETYYRENF